MSQRHWNIDFGPVRGFYRDRESGWVFGVCAGLADRFNLNVGAVRVIAVTASLAASIANAAPSGPPPETER